MAIEFRIKDLEAYSEKTENPDSQYRRLWLEVLRVAVNDAMGRFGSLDDKGFRDGYQHMAQAWLTEGSEHFYEVCGFAGIEASFALKEFRRRFGDGAYKRRLITRSEAK